MPSDLQPHHRRASSPAGSCGRTTTCVAFLSIAPMMPGHTLVVPRDEVDHWIDLEPELAAHLFQVAQRIGTRAAARVEPAPHRRADRRRGGAAHAPARRADQHTRRALASRTSTANPAPAALDAAADAHPRRAARDGRDRTSATERERAGAQP